MEKIYFPKFVKTNKSKIYKLDWSEIEEYKKFAYDEWIKPRKKIQIKNGGRYINELPEELDSWLKSVEFEITEEYMNAIYHYQELYVTDLKYEKKLKNADNLNCMEVTISIIQNLMMLLGSCYKDNENSKSIWETEINLESKKVFLISMLLRKFWIHQCSLKQIEQLSYDNLKKINSNFGKIYADYKKEFERIYHELIDAYSVLDPDGINYKKRLLVSKIKRVNNK